MVAFDSMSPHCTVLDMAVLSRMTAEMDVDVTAGGSDPRSRGTF